MMKFLKLKHCLGLTLVTLLITLILPINYSLAQSSSIIGGGTLARDCYHASQVAVRTTYSSRQDLETCNEAIIYGNLNNRDIAATYVNRGIVKVALEDYNGGKSDYEKAMALQPNKAGEAYVNRGNLWLMSKQYSRAIDDYNKALTIGVRQPYVANLNVGLAYEYLGEIGKAKDYYERALEAVPQWSVAIEKLDRVNAKIKNMPE